MKAVLFTKYGSSDVLTLVEIKKPAPRDNELLIKVRATTVTAGDCEMRSMKLPRFIRVPLRIYLAFSRPNGIILGQEVSGVIESVGRRVTKFKAGDEILAATLMHLGGYAEYVCLPEDYPVMLKPLGMTFEEAATVPTGGLNALHFLRKAEVKTGDKVLINGSGGSIGTYGVQIAKALGAGVSCVDSSRKLDMLRAIGADQVIDYEKENFTTRVSEYDVIIDVVGKAPFSETMACLRPNGRFVMGNPTFSAIIRGTRVSKSDGKKVISELAKYSIDDLNFLNNLITNGKIKPVIDKRYPLEEVADAHRYVEKGLKAGNVVINIGQAL